MPRRPALFLLAGLLVGCAGPDRRPRPPVLPTGGGRGQPDDWLGGSKPKPGAEAVLAGFVTYPDGRRATDASIEFEPDDAPASSGKAPIEVRTDAQGYFRIPGLPPKRTYRLTARAQLDGVPLSGRTYAKSGNELVTLALREDVAFPGASGGAPPAPAVVPPPSLGPLDAAIPSTTRPPPSVPAMPPEPPPTGVPPLSVLPPSPQNGPPTLPGGEGVKVEPLPPPLRAERTPAEPAPAVPTSSPAPVPPLTVLPREDLRTSGDPDRPPTMSLPPVRQAKSAPAPAVVPGSEFALVDAKGVEREFPEGKPGKLVLLDFLTSTCGPCKKYAPVLVDVHTAYAGRGLEVVGVLCDDAPPGKRAELCASYQKQQKLNYLIYTEPGESPGSLGERFALKGYPTLVLLDGSGRVLWQGHPSERAKLEAAIRAGLAE